MRKVLWGLFFIAMAGLLVLGQVMELPSTISIVLTLLVGAILIEGVLGKNLFVSVISMAIIVIINKDFLNITDISSFSIMAAALLLVIGLSIIFKGEKNVIFFKGSKCCSFDESDVGYEASDVIDVNVSFGSSIKYVTSEDFKKAMIRTSFAELQVYFDDANIVGDTAEVELDVSFAGVSLYFPKTWKIDNRVDTSFGSIEEKGRKGDPLKTIVLKGKVSLAGVEIKYV